MRRGFMDEVTCLAQCWAVAVARCSPIESCERARRRNDGGEADLGERPEGGPAGQPPGLRRQRGRGRVRAGRPGAGDRRR